MPYVENINVPPEVLELWEKSCVIRPGYWGDKVDKKNIVWRRRNFTSLIARGEFQGLAHIWNSLTVEQQVAWDDAGYWAGLSGWDLFAMDTLYRINNGIQGVATPSIYHQYKVGELKIQSPAEQAKIIQSYYFNNTGEKDFFINIFANLISTGAGSYAYVRMLVTYWDEDTEEWIVDDEFEWDISNMAGWDYFGDGGFWSSIVKYVVFEIVVYKMTGSVYFDGIEMLYNDVNVALDWQCNNIGLNWQAVIQPAGASFGTIYPPDDI